MAVIISTLKMSLFKPLPNEANPITSSAERVASMKWAPSLRTKTERRLFVENSSINMATFIKCKSENNDDFNELANDDNEIWRDYSVWKGQISPKIISLLRFANIKFILSNP